MERCESLGKGFIAVHIGAGYHSPANCDLYKEVCRKACQQAIQLLKVKKSALEAVVAAIVSLENSQWTNAGLGSNLTLAGTVECDASIMDGRSLHYGAVGAVPGVKNPIKIAESLLNLQSEGEMSLGRVPPCTLVGLGAYEWAKNHGMEIINDKNGLITENSRKAFIKNKRKLDMLNGDYDNSITGANLKILKLEDQNTINNVMNNNNSNSINNVNNDNLNRSEQIYGVSDIKIDEIASNVEISSGDRKNNKIFKLKFNVIPKNDVNPRKKPFKKCNIINRSTINNGNYKDSVNISTCFDNGNNELNDINSLDDIKTHLKNDDSNFKNINHHITINSNSDVDNIGINNNINCHPANHSDNNNNNDDITKNDVILNYNNIGQTDDSFDVMQDTVGAICVDGDGRIVSAVSSGGIILKQPGRLGQAALYGCGCWAENDENQQTGLAASTSGCGEQLIKTMLARECVASLKQQQQKKNSTVALQDCFKNKFMDSPFLRHEKQPLGGTLLVTVEKSATKTTLKNVKEQLATPTEISLGEGNAGCHNVENDDDVDDNCGKIFNSNSNNNNNNNNNDNNNSNKRFIRSSSRTVQPSSSTLTSPALTSDSSLDIELLWAHTTDSMCLGYMTTNDIQAKALVSRLPAGSQAGRSVVVQSKWCPI